MLRHETVQPRQRLDDKAARKRWHVSAHRRRDHLETIKHVRCPRANWQFRSRRGAKRAAAAATGAALTTTAGINVAAIGSFRIASRPLSRDNATNSATTIRSRYTTIDVHTGITKSNLRESGRITPPARIAQLRRKLHLGQRRVITAASRYNYDARR